MHHKYTHLHISPPPFPLSGKYDLDFKTPNNDGKLAYSGKEIADIYIDLCKKYPIVSIEDPFDQVYIRTDTHKYE